MIKNVCFVLENLWKSRTAPTPLNWENALSKTKEEETNGDSVRSQDMQVWSIKKCAEVFASSIAELKSQLANKEFLVWDKDDKPALDFVTACANVRAHIFSIAQKSRFDVKCKSA